MANRLAFTLPVVPLQQVPAGVSDGSYTGEGSFQGTGLEWTSWESMSNHIDGSFVISEDRKDEEGIHTSKIGYGMGGDPEWTMIEELSPITEEQWTTLFGELPTE